MGSQRGTDSSLTGKLRNQIGLLSPSLFLQPGKDSLGCINIVLCFFMVFAKEAFQDMGRRMLMPYPDIQSLWLPNATHIRKTFPKTYPQKSPTQLISEHSSKLQKKVVIVWAHLSCRFLPSFDTVVEQMICFGMRRSKEFFSCLALTVTFPIQL